MEGGGEGMVAIIRGLQDAGLAVTLTSGELPTSNRASLYAPRTYIPLSNRLSPTSNEGTNTNTPVTTNISAQVCDGRYTSSYQEAHCSKRPSSPPVLLSEFPLRKDASKNDGNFRVGWEGRGSGEIPSSSFRAASTSTYKPSFHYPYRGSLEFDNRASEAFAASLRRYSLSPVRTPSAELVQKLISYTLNKNTANAKATRSFSKERIDSERRRYKDKDVQTYTRSRPKKESAVENVKSNSVKRMRLHSPDKRFKDPQLNESYDYLKSTTPRYYSKQAEVRYLSDVSKCIKDTIKQIVEEQPTVCSQMHNRYLAHRKTCQQKDTKQNGKSSHMDAQASLLETKSTGTMENASYEDCLPTCPFIAPPCCYCKDRLSIPRKNSKEEFGRQVSEKIAKWLLDIPAYANMSSEEKQKRIDMVEQLANAIAALKDDEDIEEKAKRAIEKCLETLPMWLPSSKSEKADFKKLITDNLMNKLKRVFEGLDKLDDEISKWVDGIRFRSKDSLGEVIDNDEISNMIAERLRPLTIERLDDDDYHEVLKNEIVDILKELPVEIVGNKEQFINSLAEKLTNIIKKIPASEIKPSSSLKGDEFDYKISQWIKEIKFKKRDSLGQVVDKQKIADIFSERLKDIARDRPEDDDDYHEALKNEIIDVLEDLPIEVIGPKDKFVEKLADKLTKTIGKIPASKIQPKTDKFEDTISQWISGIKFKKRDSQGNVVDKHEIAHTFADRLKALAIDRPEDDEEYHDTLKEEIVDILDQLPIEIIGNKKQFVNKLADKLTNIIKKIPSSEIKPKGDKFDDKISQWIGDIKFKNQDSQGNVVDKTKIANAFAERLKSVALDRPEDDEEYHDALKQEIVDILDELPIEIIGNKEQFVDKLASKLTNMIKKIPISEIKPKRNKFDEKISEFIGDIKFKKRDSQGNVVDKTKIANTFADRLKSVALDRPEDDEEYHDALKQEIVDILDELPIEIVGNKEQFVDKLASKLTNMIKKIPTSEINPKRDKFDEKISEFIGDIKFKKRDSQGNVVDKKEIANTFAERLKSVALDRPEDDEEYHDALKQEIVDILDELPIEIIGNKEQFVDKLASKLTNMIKKIPTGEIKPKRDKFDEKISDFLGDIKLKKRDSQGNVADKRKIANTFAERLKSIALERPEDDEEYQDALKQEIVDILDELPIEIIGNKDQFVDKLAGKLTNMIKKIPPSEIKPKSDIFNEKISQWIGDIKFKKRDSKGNLVDKKKIANTFSERLKSIAIERPADDNEYHESLKNEIIDILDELPIEIVGNKEQFVDKLATKLINIIKKIPANEIKPKPSDITNQLQGKIIDWLKDIPELSAIADTKDKDNRKMVEKLVKKLQVMQSKGMDKESVKKEMHKEIINWMQSLLTQDDGYIDPKTKSLLAEKLIGNLTESTVSSKRVQVKSGKPSFTEEGRSDEDYKKDCSKEIRSWLENIPELSGSEEQNNIMAENLAKKFQELQSRGVEDVDEIQDEITNWLLTESEKKGLHLEVRAKDDLIKQLASKIAKVKPPRRTSDKFEDKMNKEIWNGLKNLPGIKESVKNNELIKQLSEKVISISNEHGEEVSDEIIQEEVKHWVDDFINSSGFDINSKNKDKLVEDLTSKMKCILKPNARLNETKEIISKEISDIMDSSTSKLSPEEKENVERRVSSLLARNIDNMLSSDINKIKQNILKILDQETNVSAAEAEKLAESFLNNAKKTSGLRRKSILKSESPEEVREVIQEKVKNALDDFDISIPKEIENNLTDLLEEQVLNGVDSKITKNKIREILQSTGLSKENVDNLTTKLTLQAIDLSSIQHGADTTLRFELTLTEKELFETSAVQDIADFMDDVTGDMDPKYKRKVKAAAQKLAERLGDTISDPNKSIQEKEDILSTEVSNFLKSFSVPDEYGPVLVNQLRNLALSSTPRQSEHGYSFHPKRSSFTMDDNSLTSLVDIIQNWIHNLPIEFGDKNLVRSIAKDLANDIADRQKYLQSHPDIKQSDDEKLEFLKYQVFRALGKSVEVKDLAIVMNQTASLLRQVKEIAPPMLTSPSGGDLWNKFLNEISMWLGDISADIKKEYLDDNRRPEMVNELAENIQNVLKSGLNIDDEITRWLTRIVKDVNQINIKNMSDDLKHRLKTKGLIKEIADAISQSISGDQIQQDTSQFLEENLSTGISDWLKSLPLYQRRTSKEKRVQESIVQDLIKDIKNILLSPQDLDETDLDVLILQTVRKHIERFPMDKEHKSDKAYIEKVAAQLVDYLNNMQLFDYISSRQSIHPIEYLISTINDWMNSIPIDPSNFDPDEIDTLKMNFLNRLNRLLKDSSQQNDELVKDEIKHFLERLPLVRNKSQDPKFIAKKVEDLFNRILGTPFLSKPGRPTINRDLVESAVQDWSVKLPYSSGQSRKNVSDKIQNFASDISNMLKDTNVTAVDNYKDNLREKTIDFLKQMPIKLDNLTPEDLKRLADDLLTSIKNKGADLSPKPVSKNAADTLYENIATWCDDLPISEGNTPEEKERVNTMKQNLTSRLVNKIGELNMNPEIFYDDFLYEHLLQEEIDDLLSGLPPSPEIENNLQSIKENLMTKVKEAKQKTKDELAGQTYKQQLRETISKSLPFDMSLSSEEPEAFEVLVDNLADAYVDLHFIANNEEQKAKYKKKIADEITKYCNDYLKRHPEAPLDSIKINQDLYNALKSIPTPKDEIMRSEAEHVRIKDEINDWMKELPLAEGDGPQKAQKNKMASMLAKKLLEIEKNKGLNQDTDYEENAHKEISKLLKKLPLQPEREADIDRMIQKLIDKLKNTETSRRISASTTRQSIDVIPDLSDATETSVQGSAESSEDRLCPCHRKHKQKPSKNICHYKSTLPKSTLSTEDRAHLERIRIRTPLTPCRIHRVCSCKDASVNPLPIDTASQTDVCPNVSPRSSPCPAQSQQEISPQIIIKEYLWDSGNSKLLGPVYRLPCVEMDTSNSSVPSLQRPLQKSVSIQPSPCIIPPCPRKSPCTPIVTAPRPCLNLQRSPCQSPHQLSTPKPCIHLPRTVIPSLTSNNCVNRSVNTAPCDPPPCLPKPPCAPQEIPYCSTPRRPVLRDIPCIPLSFSKPCSPNDTESDVGPSRCFPRVINLGSFNDEPKRPCPPCQGRRIIHDEQLSDYNDCQDYRRKIYRMPNKPCVEGRRCCKYNNRTPKNVYRHLANTPCQSSENVRQCNKCCGMPCPHPTGLFFR